MKKTKNKLLLNVLIVFLCAGFSFKTLAQQKLIYYWNFNNLNTGLTAAGSPSLIKSIHANWGALDSTKATISYTPAYTVSALYKTYWDNVAGDASDTFNVRFGGPKGATAGNNALRVRNPSDSMQLLFNLPTTKYKNITIKFANEKSSFGPTGSAPAKETFDYSTDGGSTWKTSGLSFPDDSFNNGTWNLVAVSLANDASVNNNANFIFRIKFSTPNSGTSGNNRFDNVTLEGDSIAAPVQKLIHYWNFNNLSTGTTKAGSPLLIKAIHANWSSIDSTKALVLYAPYYVVSSKYATYWDNVAGDASDTINVRFGGLKGAATGNNALRARNPSDSMALYWYLPTTKYKNINIKYALELSSFGPTGSAGGRELFDYSVDSGKTYRQNGLSITQDSIVNGTFNLISINLSADPAVNNSNKFIFRIRTTKPNSGTSGNHRYDNFTVEGDTLITTPPKNVRTPLYKIRQVRVQDPVTGVADSVNKAKGYLKGVVESPSFSKSYLQFSLRDSTGAITIYSSAVKTYTPAVGDSIEVHGYVTQYNGVTEYTTDSVFLLNSGNKIEPPIVVSAMSETNESHLIEFKNVHVISGWATTGSSLTVNVTNGPDTLQLYITSATSIIGTTIPIGNFNVFGIESQYKSSSPYIGGYQLEPRFIADIQLIPNSKPLYTIGQVRPQNLTTGVADSLNKAKGFIKGVVMSPSFSKSYLQFSLVDNTGAITIYSSSVKYYTPSVGDSIIAHGYVTQYNGVTEYTTDSIIVLPAGTKLETPNVITAMNETYESHLVEIKNVHIISGWSGSTSYTVNVTNGPDTFQLYITSATGIIGTTAPAGNFNVFGIESQYKSSSPYIGGYQLEPRFIADIQLIPIKPLYTIAQVTPFNSTTGVADSLANTTLAKGYLKGVVMSPSFSKSYLQFSLVDATGAITIYNSSIKYYTPKIGDSILVHGYLDQYNGVMEYTVDTIAKLTAGTWLETPTVLTALSEKYESQLVEIKNVHIISGWSGSTSYTVNVTNGPDTFQLYITSATGIIGTAAPKGNFNVFGIESEYKSSAPYTSGYQLEPRFIADIQPIPVKLYTIAQVEPYNATTGVADSIGLYCYLKGVVQSPNITGSSLLEGFAVQDNTGGISVAGIANFGGYTPNVGDSVVLRGTVSQSNGLTIFLIDSISKRSGGSAISPVVVTTLGEATESKLVTMKTYKLTTPSSWDVAKAVNGLITVQATQFGTSNTITLVIANGTNLYANSSAPTGYFDVTGIGSQNDPAAPFLSDYVLIPRSTSDFAHSSGIENGIDVNTQISVYPNPASDFVNISSSSTISRITVIDMLGNTVVTEIPNAGLAKINTSGFSKGVYILKVDSETDSYVTRFMKE